jgi:hypothetical protein
MIDFAAKRASRSRLQNLPSERVFIRSDEDSSENFCQLNLTALSGGLIAGRQSDVSKKSRCV